MKRYLYIIAGLLLAWSCTDLNGYEEDIENIKTQLEQIATECAKINERIESMQALAAQVQARESITGISEIIDESGKVTGYVITFKNADTKEGVTMGYKIIDKTRILLKSDEAINLSVTLSASYYKPLINTDVDEGEIVGAREGKASLRDNMIRKINYKPFTADRLYEG